MPPPRVSLPFHLVQRGYAFFTIANMAAKAALRSRNRDATPKRSNGVKEAISPWQKKGAGKNRRRLDKASSSSESTCRSTVLKAITDYASKVMWDLPEARREEEEEKKKKKLKFKIVEAVNGLSLQSFVDLFMPHDALTMPEEVLLSRMKSRSRSAASGHTENEYYYYLTCSVPADMTDADLEACFKLIEESSADLYRESGVGWKPAEKRAEMRLKDLKYLLVRRKNTGSISNSTTTASATASASASKPTNSATRAAPSTSIGNAPSDVEGFMSMMVTYEDGCEVMYCYEIHLSPALRGLGIGSHLMSVLEDVGKNTGMEKTMLTVFKSNIAAMRFYRRLGYVVDPFSPQPKVLRNGTVKEASYVVMSKGLNRKLNGKDEETKDD